MANIEKSRRKDGSEVYYIRVHRGRGADGKQLKPFCTMWEPTPGMSAAKVRKELQKYVTLFEENCRNGMETTGRKTFTDYALYVIDMKERGGLKHRTAVRYRELLERINDIEIKGFGYMKLAAIRPDTLNRFYAALSKEGANKRTGGGLSPKTILEHHRFASTVFSQALREGLIPFNPAERATPPKVPHKEAEAFTIEEVQAIIEAVETEPTQWQAMTHLLLGTGARRGEILGLRWSDIDFPKAQLHLCNNLLYSPDRGVYTDTLKTDESRHVTIATEIMRLLKRHRAEQTAAMREIGSKSVYSGYVFTQWDGHPMHPDSVTDYFKKLSAKCGIHINPHKFRHTQASLLISEGVDIVTVSKRLGHAKTSTTTDIYAHMIQKADENANKVLAQIIYKTCK